MSISKFRNIVADLVDDVVSSYDQTKTTTQGRITSKLLSGNTCLGAPLNKFIDCFNDAAITPANIAYLSPNGRLYVLAAEAGGVAQLGLWTVDFTNMNTAYVGKISISLPDSAATTHTYRMFKALDSGTTGWKLFIATTGSVVINGGTFMANDIALSDFVPIGFPTIPFATGNSQKAVYFMQDATLLGAAHTTANVANTQSVGGALDSTNSRLYVHDGVAATHRYFVYDTSAAPTWASRAVTGTAATDIINDAGHPFINGDQLVFTSITGGAGLTAGTVYFVVGSVAGVSYQLSATSGGAAINFTTDISAGTIGRAFGISSANFLHKTGNLPALTGTLLANDSEDYAVPSSINVSIDGFPCVAFSTSSQIYIGRLSELTVGAVTWPSLQTVNVLGAANTITAPTAANFAWSTVLNRGVFLTNTSVFAMKSFVNNAIEFVFGGINNEYHEGYPSKETIPLGLAAVGAMDLENGILAVAGTTVGQRGVILCDLRSQAEFDYSYIVTKVLNTPDSIYRFIATLDELFEFTGSNTVYYRTSGFGSISGGWTALPYGEELEGIVTPGDQVQFKILSDHLGLDTCIPAQIYEFILGYESLYDSSEHWQVSKDLSSTGGTHKVVWYLSKAFESGSVPVLYARAFQQGTDTSVGSNNTSGSPASFRYSTNGGSTWNNLGTIPNVVGTLVEWTISPTPTVDYLPTLRES